MTFYLGTHQPGWLGWLGVPLFVSRRRLAGRKTLPRAAAPWALDSGGFSELRLFGRWTVGAAQYAEEVERYAEGIGGLAWAAIMDWMCEPVVIEGGRGGPATFAGTGLGVREHQERTVQSYLDLAALAPALPWTPVVQGYRPDEYLACVELYRSAGVDLATFPVVGVGSVCRRQGTAEAATIFRSLARLGLRCHGFGLKTLGLPRLAGVIESADSMAWSAQARRQAPLPGCTTHANCANCPRYALAWRERVLAACATASRPRMVSMRRARPAPGQRSLFDP